MDLARRPFGGAAGREATSKVTDGPRSSRLGGGPELGMTSAHCKGISARIEGDGRWRWRGGRAARGPAGGPRRSDRGGGAAASRPQAPRVPCGGVERGRTSASRPACSSTKGPSKASAAGPARPPPAIRRASPPPDPGRRLADRPGAYNRARAGVGAIRPIARSVVNAPAIAQARRWSRNDRMISRLLSQDSRPVKCGSDHTMSARGLQYARFCRTGVFHRPRRDRRRSLARALPFRPNGERSPRPPGSIDATGPRQGRRKQAPNRASPLAL